MTVAIFVTGDVMLDVTVNTAKGWSRNVTVDIADELHRRAEYDDVPVSVE